MKKSERCRLSSEHYIIVAINRREENFAYDLQQLIRSSVIEEEIVWNRKMSLNRSKHNSPKDISQLY